MALVVCRGGPLRPRQRFRTDGAASENMLHILGSEMRIGAIQAKEPEGDPAAFTAYDAVEMATLGGAKVLGRAAEASARLIR